MSFTVVPLHNLYLPPGTKQPFGPDFTIEEIPQWLLDDPLVKAGGVYNVHSIAHSKFALTAEYEATAIGEPDPYWKGQQLRTIQDSKAEAATMANFALWLTQPSSVCINSIFHALSRGTSVPIILQINHETTLFCHPDDVGKSASLVQVRAAANLYTAMRDVPRKNSVWTALRIFWAGLTTNAEDIRFTFFWIGLEALFGPDGNTGEVAHKLATRIAFFLSDTPEDARSIFSKVKACYAMRSKIVHGRWNNDKEMADVTIDTEKIVQRVLVRLLTDPMMMKTFLSRQRDQFLDDWMFSRSTDTPPYPVIG